MEYTYFLIIIKKLNMNKLCTLKGFLLISIKGFDIKDSILIELTNESHEKILNCIIEKVSFCIKQNYLLDSKTYFLLIERAECTEHQNSENESSFKYHNLGFIDFLKNNKQYIVIFEFLDFSNLKISNINDFEDIDEISDIHIFNKSSNKYSYLINNRNSIMPIDKIKQFHDKYSNILRKHDKLFFLNTNSDINNIFIFFNLKNININSKKILPIFKELELYKKHHMILPWYNIMLRINKYNFNINYHIFESIIYIKQKFKTIKKEYVIKLKNALTENDLYFSKIPEELNKIIFNYYINSFIIID